MNNLSANHQSEQGSGRSRPMIKQFLSAGREGVQRVGAPQCGRRGDPAGGGGSPE